MKISGDWIRAAHVQAVLSVLDRGGHAALLVGGCVRNDLLGQPVSDIDIATDAQPLRVVELAAAAGIRTVPTGIDHGTVTLLVHGIAHEVTTFRRDVATDGRRATVAFTRDLAEDAARRDFTMNALYARADGRVLDPIGGYDDLRARRVRFVGDPVRRIREDYLRILRFFRFHAWYGDPARGLDPEALAACAAQADGLGPVSHERIGHEMRRLLAAPDPAPALAAMQAAGILHHVLPGADARDCAVLVHLEGGMSPSWLRRLALLGGEDPATALRLSREEERARLAIRAAALDTAGAAELGYRLGAGQGADALLVRAALTGQPLPPGWADDLARGAQAVFPLRAADFMPDLSGEALGQRLRQAEAAWVASGFGLSREQLLS
ncbi:MAG: hypothetical protein RLZZ528_341 [Pseudomonadota bacterium]|jgi:poly(A) polymerase